MVIDVVNKVSYIIMSVLFFNLFFVFNYYFKIVNFLYIDFMFDNLMVKIIFVNFLVIFFDVIFITLYNFLKLYKLSYFLIILVGLLIGVLVSVLILKRGYELCDYLSIISFSIINVLFLSYSLYFEKEKQKVFG